jgi:hypothetical protein
VPNVTIQLPAITDPTKQCYFVRAIFDTSLAGTPLAPSITSVTDDAGNVYAGPFNLAGTNFGFFAMNAKSASVCTFAYKGGLGRVDEDLWDAHAVRVQGIAPSKLRALNFAPFCWG